MNNMIKVLLNGLFLMGVGFAIIVAVVLFLVLCVIFPPFVFIVFALVTGFLVDYFFLQDLDWYVDVKDKIKIQFGIE